MSPVNQTPIGAAPGPFGADSIQLPIDEADVTGLVADLANRIEKGHVFAGGGDSLRNIITTGPEESLIGFLAVDRFGLAQEFAEIGANRVLVDTDITFLSCFVNSITITLPAGATNAGKMFIIKGNSLTSGATPITIDGNGAETIDGAATYVLNTAYQVVRLIYNLARGEWSVI